QYICKFIFQEYLGMRTEYVDSMEVARRAGQNLSRCVIGIGCKLPNLVDVEQTGRQIKAHPYLSFKRRLEDTCF
ncbi:MAG: hypothetical protein EOP54_21020, partial [Sphingobacteriales bacterium]